MMGALWEAIAFGIRFVQTRHQDSGYLNLGFQMFYFLAPLWINAFLYMTLGRMIHFYDESKQLAGLSAKAFTRLFVVFDIISFIVQVAGAGMSGAQGIPQSLNMLGVHIYMGGIGLQQFFMSCFTVLLVLLQVRMGRNEHVWATTERMRRGPWHWRWLFIGIYTALLLITVSQVTDTYKI